MRAAVALAVLFMTGVAAQEAGVSDTAKLQRMTSRFAPTNIRVDLTTLSAADQKVLAKLVEASQIMDAIFLRQVWAGNEAMRLAKRAVKTEETTTADARQALTMRA